MDARTSSSSVESAGAEDAVDSVRPLAAARRFEIYRALSDAVRVRLLALSSLEELSIGELAEILGEGQPKISRHATALREVGLIRARRQGTWVLVRIAPLAERDPVVLDALTLGRAMIREDGSLRAMERVVLMRDEKAREFFARAGRPIEAGPPAELGAYLRALAPLFPKRSVAVDAGTGDGALLEVLCPIFERVIAIDRSHEQLARARGRAERRGFSNVEFHSTELDPSAQKPNTSALAGVADVVFASRVLHHAASPKRAFVRLVEMAKPSEEPCADSSSRGGAVLVIDYASHDDATFHDSQADVWLGFGEDELREFAVDSGLTNVTLERLPTAFSGDGPDRHLPWILLAGFRGRSTTVRHKEYVHE